MPLLGSLVNAAHKSVGAECGDNSDDEEPHAGAVLVHLRDLFLLLFGLKEARVGAELENEVRDVCAQEHERGAARQGE